MIKLLKYDWKRNANTLIAAAVIMIIAQALLVTAAYRSHWGVEAAYATAAIVHTFAGILSFIMICQTYGANIKAYSRRLLPLPPLYAAAPPALLFLGCQVVLLLTFVATDYAISIVYDTGSLLLATVPVDIAPAGYVSLAAGALLAGIGICATVFFSITAAATIQGKAGVWFGMAVFAAFFTAKTWLDSLLFPDDWIGDSPYFGFTVTEGQADGLAVSVSGLRTVEWLSLLYELAVVGALLYGIHYMLTRKIKL